MSQVVKDLLTGKDGVSHDLGRWSWVACFFAIVAATVSNMVHGQMVDVVQLATAFSIVAGAHGAAIWAKKDTEPTV